MNRGPADRRDDQLAELSGTERAVYGDAVSPGALLEFMDVWVRTWSGSKINSVVFRAGRIDVVWGVGLDDGRQVVIKTHREPADLTAITVARDAQVVLAGAGFPCAQPLAGPDVVGSRTLSAEMLITGKAPDGRTAEGLRLLTAGLAEHIDILRRHPDLVERAGAGPAWCRYQDGPWPTPHDTLVDLTITPPEYGWVDDFGRQAAEQTVASRDPDAVVAGHADWYAGNAAVVDGTLVGTFDWELVADTEAVIAGLSAAGYASNATAGGGLSTPAEVAAFLADYELVLARSFTGRERRAAAGAAAWVIAFNARWHVALIPHGICDEATVNLARDHGPEYLSLDW